MSSARSGSRFAAVLILLAGCKKDAPAPPVEKAEIAEMDKEEPVRPTYPIAAGAPDPGAARICRLIHSLREERRVACCGGLPGVSLVELCSGTLTAALAGRGVELDTAAADACEAALSKLYAGCDWVGPLPAALPDPCRKVVRGVLDEGARCRSSLECRGDLHCHGASPSQYGICGPARRAGAGCNRAVDPLAAYLRNDDIDRERPECQGACLHNRCVPPVALGTSCVSPAQCGAGRHCGAGVCVEGAFARAGQACTSGGCESGLRCVGGKCIAPAAGGAACGSDFDCRGACLKGDGGARCGMDCSRR